MFHRKASAIRREFGIAEIFEGEGVLPMRRVINIRVCTALLLGLLAGSSPAQQHAQPTAGTATDSSRGSQLKVNPLKALQQVEAPLEEAYKMGAGDTINRYVAEYPG